MSRGPGRWQRAILAALGEYDVVVIRDLCSAVLGRPPRRAELVAVRRAELVAVRRAAHSLADAGKLREIYPWYCHRHRLLLREMPGPGHRCYLHKGCALAVTRDPDVMHPRLVGTPLATAIPERLCVAFGQPADQGNAYGRVA